MAQSLAWGADLLLSPRIATGVSLAIALQVASASMEGAWLPLLAPREKGQGGCLIALGQTSGRHVSFGLVICTLEMEREALRGSKS